MHLLCIGKIREYLLDYFLLFFGDRQILFAVIDLFHTLTGGNIFEIVARFFTGFDIFELGYEPCDSSSPPILMLLYSSSDCQSIAFSNEKMP